jgi:hypothetical protein
MDSGRVLGFRYHAGGLNLWIMRESLNPAISSRLPSVLLSRSLVDVPPSAISQSTPRDRDQISVPNPPLLP